MGVLGRMDVEIDIKSSGDVFHELWGSKPHDVCNITPHRVQGCGVHEGEFGQSGSVLFWNYTFDGKECTSKVIVEAKDDEKLVRFTHIEGFLLEEYKSFVVTLQVTNKDDEITAVKWTFEFEKFDDYGPYPTKLVDFMIETTREIEAHHLKE